MAFTRYLILLLVISGSLKIQAEEIPFTEQVDYELPEEYVINFNNVSIVEFIRFVSKISEVNFIFDERLLDFTITLVSGKPTPTDHILNLLIDLFNQHGFKARPKNHYFLVERMDASEIAFHKHQMLLASAPKPNVPNREYTFLEETLNGDKILTPLDFLVPKEKKSEFFVYKLQYNRGSEIENVIKQIAAGLSGNKEDEKLKLAIKSMQWVESTNSMLYSGSSKAITGLTNLIKSIDVPQKQVFIEVLVIETDVKNGLEFGLQWAGGGKIRDGVGFAGGNFSPGAKPAAFAKTFKDINATNTPTGTNQFPLGNGFDLGVIGDIIFHRGKSFLSLASLVSALQEDGDSTIILNQKIITQDNKLSTIFVGDNIPFTGSIVETIGSSQQTTANIEYRDVGVSLNITPYLGDDDVITLEISEEITEATNNLIHTSNHVNGIQTTKTNMVTRVHVPDQNFLVLSGMIRNTKTHRKSGIPCLGGLPFIGAAFSKTTTDAEKRNVIIFVHPKIINNTKEYEDITVDQTRLFKSQSGSPEEFEKGLQTNGTNQPEYPSRRP